MLKTAHKNIRQLSLNELEQYFETIGEKKFRTGQVWEWLWQKGAFTLPNIDGTNHTDYNTMLPTLINYLIPVGLKGLMAAGMAAAGHRWQSAVIGQGSHSYLRAGGTRENVAYRR